jgi:hypothetical protein
MFQGKNLLEETAVEEKPVKEPAVEEKPVKEASARGKTKIKRNTIRY